MATSPAEKSTRALHTGVTTSLAVSTGMRAAGAAWNPALLKTGREENIVFLCNTPARKTLPKTLTSLIKLSH